MLTVILLIISNAFMTFAWYGRLKYRSAPIVTVVLRSIWGLPAQSFACLFGAVAFAFWGRF